MWCPNSPHKEDARARFTYGCGFLTLLASNSNRHDVDWEYVGNLDVECFLQVFHDSDCFLFFFIQTFGTDE
jgi:hypothetical protein